MDASFMEAGFFRYISDSFQLWQTQLPIPWPDDLVYGVWGLPSWKDTQLHSDTTSLPLKISPAPTRKLTSIPTIYFQVLCSVRFGGGYWSRLLASGMTVTNDFVNIWRTIIIVYGQKTHLYGSRGEEILTPNFSSQGFAGTETITLIS